MVEIRDFDAEKVVYIVTGFEMEELKKHSFRLMKVLPENPNTALLMITFLKQHMEEVIGRKVEAVKVLSKPEQEEKR